jgi:hypothetical protein
MGTMIDALFLEVGIDPSKFKRGASEVEASSKKLTESVRKSGNDVEASSRKGTQSLEKMKAEALTLFAVFTAGKGIRQFVEDLVVMNAGLGRTAYTLDTTVQKLGTWVAAGSQVGASSQDIIGSFQSLTSQFQQFALTGDSSVLPFFRALNVDISDGQGRMRDMGEVFLDLADRFKAMDPARAAEFGRQMGLTPGMINLLIQGRKAVEEYLAAGRKYAPTQEDVLVAQRLQRSWNELSMASTKMGRTFLTEIGPALVWLMDKLTAMANWLSEHPKILTLVIGALTAAVAALTTAIAVGLVRGALVAMMGGFKMILGFLPALFLNLAVLTETTLPALAGAFLAVGVAIESMMLPLLAAYGLYLLVKNTAPEGTMQNGPDGKPDPSTFKPNWRKNHPWMDKPLFGEAGDKSPAEKVKDAVAGWFDKKDEKTEAHAKTLQGIVSGWFKGPEQKPKSDGLADLIARGEGGYNSVNLGQKGGYKPSKRNLEGMTLKEVMDAQARGEFNAAGRYQVVRDTLAGAAKGLGLKGDEKFDKALQDRIFNDYLIATKQKAIGDFVSGRSGDLNAAVKAASREWASVADPDTGRSHYDGVGGNRATISAEEVAAALQKARAQNVAKTLAQAPAGAGVAAANDNSRRYTSTSSNETSIGTINFNGTSIKDAPSAAAGLKAAIGQNSFAEQANFSFT